MRFESPLQWLPQQPRTKRPQRARFGNHSISKAANYFIDELKRLGAKNCIISSNLQPRQRGDGFYSNQRIDDAGVVVYFDLKGQSKAMACDLWDKPEHNLWALYLSVQAIRGLERWGGSEFLDGLFTGFKALPSPDNVIMSAPSYFLDCVDLVDVKRTFKNLAKELHPDKGGSVEDFNELKRQYDIALSKGAKQ